MAKIGILTLYHENYNYGGILQACALCNVLNNMGHECEVLSYSDSFNPVYPSMTKRIQQYGVVELFKKVKEKVSAKIGSKEFSQIFQQRKTKIEEFKNTHIPSTTHYNDELLLKNYSDFDVLISGSDQVWNPNCARKGFLQMFPHNGIRKVSYAASISRNSLSEYEKSIMLPQINDFDFISVREKTAKELLAAQGFTDVQVTIDPTFLLSSSCWETMMSDRVVPEEYALCYFFSDSREYRRYLKSFCDKEGIKLVHIPYAKQEFNRFDKDGCGEPLFDVGPAEFLSLFKYAKYVFTDSFHGMAFSIIFKKNFRVLKRDKESKVSMNSRISDLLSTLSLSDRLVDDISAVSNNSPVNFEDTENAVKALQSRSIEFLKKSIEMK